MRVYSAIRSDGTQAAVLAEMQTRAELYDLLGYEAYERRADEHAAVTGSRPG
jgi:methylisocitrate lyase